LARADGTHHAAAAKADALIVLQHFCAERLRGLHPSQVETRFNLTG
jgi:hypothetical protein